jgi:hypothetical protein
VARYIPIARRRRNAALVTIAALFVGIALGWLVGKQSAPSVSSAVHDAQQRGADIAVQLERLPIEYKQTINGSGEDTVQKAVLTPLDDLQADATNAFDQAPWVASAARATAQDAIAEVRQAAQNAVSADEFETAVNDAADAIRSAFGLAANGP